MVSLRVVIAFGLISVQAYCYGSESKPFDRIVSLSPAMTRMLGELEQSHRLVGVTRFCKIPVTAKLSIRVVGGALDPEVETILALQPDIVLASSLLPENIEKRFQSLGISVERFRQDRLEDIADQVLWIGAHTGSLHKARQEVQHARELVRRASAVSASSPSRTGLLVFSEEMQLVAGGETFPSEVMELAGLENVATSLSQPWPTVSHEWLLMQNPDWIVVATEKPSSAVGPYREQILSDWRENKTFAQLSAVQSGQVIIVAESQMIVPSLQVFKVIDLLQQEVQLRNKISKEQRALR